ncbi:apolipoprotein L6 isoform X4 [Perca flavescens]|uniref:apolipoprotein L6 isoform X4 n=1 Tax=Perca flavescens TaxID=8167 RepID=UPI00106EDDED|nr:apolipoprotein L6-like isoform X4 [Perca flavescens]
MQNLNPFKSTPQVSKAASSESLEYGRVSDTNQNPGMLKGVMQKVNPFKPSAQVPKSDPQNDAADPPVTGKELQGKQNPSMIAAMMQKVNPFKSSQPQSSQDNKPLHTDLSSSTGSLADRNSGPEKQEPHAIHSEHSSSSDSVDDSTIERHTLRIRRILPSALFGSGTKEVVEVQTLEMAEVPVPNEGTVLDPLEDEEGLLAWWRTVGGWDEWNQTNQNDEPEEVVEQAADRVFMAAQLFVRFFNQRGASLQQRILELLALADSADVFHKKTVKACVGGGVASVAGSITTITGLILAPFTAGASLIVTAVGIGVATAGGVASASANITDTVHSKTDRKKVEQTIKDYEEEMKDIKECLEFLQEGMETLEEWNFEKYVESIAQKHLNKNVEHVMKEGGRAGKALMINTESLISTVQVLSVAGGAAKAAQVMSVTTGVMSGLFLALDIFFLAKDTMELKKGAKTEFAAKIREVCRDLQDGLLELNRIKEQLQKTIDGIEVEVDKEEEDEELLRSELKKLAEFEE